MFLGVTPIISVAFASSSTDFWNSFGNIGGPIFWAAGLGSSLVQDGHEGLEHAARTADGMIVSFALDEGMSRVIRERRPYSNNLDSFPSGHATLSFAAAASQSYFHPKEAVFWYAGASLIAFSRIPAHEHHWQDVIAGAALGYGAGQLSASSRRGWLLAPLVESGHVGATAMVSMSF